MARHGGRIARRRARGDRRVEAGGLVTLGTCLAAAAAASGVLGAWDVLATAEAARLVARLELAIAPLGRARREGLAPSAIERRRLGWLAAGSLLAAGWLVGGLLVGLGAALTGPALVLGAVRARRAPPPPPPPRGAAGPRRRR